MSSLETTQRFLDSFFETEKHRLLNFTPVAIGIGICIYFRMDEEPAPFVGFALLGLSSVLLLGYSLLRSVLCKIFQQEEGAKHTYHKYLWNCIFFGFFFISLGFFVSQIRTRTVNTFMLSEGLDEPITFVATVDSCEKNERGLKFLVSNLGRKYNDSANEVCQNLNTVHLIWVGEKAREASESMEFLEDCGPGSRVLFRAVLSPVGALAFPGAYDFRKQQYFKRISARGFIIKPPKLLFKSSQSTMKMHVEQIRHKINAIIDSILRNKDAAAIAKALSTGSTSGITKDIREKFSNSGIAHILAISGLHIGIIAFFVFLIFRLLLCSIPLLSRFLNSKKYAAMISWGVVFLYLQISGCSVSSVRAFIMHSVVVLAILLDRTAFTMRSVALAATIIMLSMPEVIMFPSFQMSFGAVIAIISYVESSWSKPRFLKWLLEVVITTVLASVPTAIISVAVFNQLTLNSVLANIICIPLMTFFVMPLLMLGMFMMLFGVSGPVIGAAGKGIEILIKIAELASQLPGSHFVMHTPTDLIFGIVVVSFLIFTMIQHSLRRIGLLGMLIGATMYSAQPLSDVFVAPMAKAVGIRTPDGVTCFSHKGYFRDMGESWSKSVGAEKRENFRSKACSKWVKKLDEDGCWEALVRGKKLLIFENSEFYKKKFGDKEESTDAARKADLGRKDLEIVIGEGVNGANGINESGELVYFEPRRFRIEHVKKRGRMWE